MRREWGAEGVFGVKSTVSDFVICPTAMMCFTVSGSVSWHVTPLDWHILHTGFSVQSLPRIPNGSVIANWLTSVPSLTHLWGSLSLLPFWVFGPGLWENVVKSSYYIFIPCNSIAAIPLPGNFVYNTWTSFSPHIWSFQVSGKTVNEVKFYLVISTCPDIVLRIPCVTRCIFFKTFKFCIGI